MPSLWYKNFNGYMLEVRLPGSAIALPGWTAAGTSKTLACNGLNASALTHNDSATKAYAYGYNTIPGNLSANDTLLQGWYHYHLFSLVN